MSLKKLACHLLILLFAALVVSIILIPVCLVSANCHRFESFLLTDRGVSFVFIGSCCLSFFICGTYLFSLFDYKYKLLPKAMIVSVAIGAIATSYLSITLLMSAIMNARFNQY